MRSEFALCELTFHRTPNFALRSHGWRRPAPFVLCSLAFPADTHHQAARRGEFGAARQGQPPSPRLAVHRSFSEGGRPPAPKARKAPGGEAPGAMK